MEGNVDDADGADGARSGMEHRDLLVVLGADGSCGYGDCRMVAVVTSSTVMVTLMSFAMRIGDCGCQKWLDCLLTMMAQSSLPSSC